MQVFFFIGIESVCGIRLNCFFFFSSFEIYRSIVRSMPYGFFYRMMRCYSSRTRMDFRFIWCSSIFLHFENQLVKCIDSSQFNYMVTFDMITPSSSALKVYGFVAAIFVGSFFSLSLTPPRRVQMKFLLTPPPPAPPTYACTHTQYTNTRAYLLVRWIFCTLFVSMMNKHFNRWWRVYFQKKIIQINIVRPKQTKSEPYAIDAHFKGSNTKKIDTFMHMVN